MVTTTRRKPKIKTYKSLDDDRCLTYVQKAYIEEGKHGQTSRHFFYKLLGYKAIEFTSHKNSSKNAYAYVCRLLVKARESGKLPWSAVIDPGRRYYGDYSTDLKSYAKTKMGAYISLDPWRGQPQKVEIWVEKEAMAALVRTIVSRTGMKGLDDLRVPVCINKGYGSVTVIKDAAERYGTGKGWTLLYIGDFDPSGLDIDRALRDGLRKYGARPNIERVALTQEDTISLIPMAGLSLKKSDSRYKQFVELYGLEQQGYEIDSLPVHLLRKKLIQKLSLYMDFDAFKKLNELEDAISEQLAKKLDGVLNGTVKRLLKKGVPDSTLSLEEQLRYLLPEDEVAKIASIIVEADSFYDDEDDFEDEDEDEDSDEEDYDEDEDE
ncbi:MAG: hypothetical protein AUF65_02650 [Chloroflexi bacterium 13_1_20CM_50_12]|nr:MAG: hypothetical protein AUF65_02650 [Chloroflexi bacterium 13_1_20CM_50_12]